MARLSGVVGLVELREHDGARGHVHTDRERLGGEDELDQALLEAELDKLAQDGQHAAVVVGYTPLEQVHHVRVRLELTKLGHVPLQVRAVHGVQGSLGGLDECAPLGLRLLEGRPLLFSGVVPQPILGTVAAEQVE